MAADLFITKLVLLSGLLVFSSTLLTAQSQPPFASEISPESIGLTPKPEKLSHLHFYFHDQVSGPNATVIGIAEAATTNTSKTFLGATFMMDDLLTVSSDPKSKAVGRAQGIYASASESEAALLMVLNFAFTEGKYNGSNLSVLGRNAVFSPVREMPVVGGSGLFRFARGYAEARTHVFDLKTGDAVVEYNVYVFHYLSDLGRKASE